LPSIAKNREIDLTKYEISIVNIGNVGFAHYEKIFLRKEEPYLNVPVAIITDCDVKEYCKSTKEKRDVAVIEQEIKYKIQENERINNRYNIQKVKKHISPKWTLEYCLFHSKIFKDKFIEIIRTIHPNTEEFKNECDFEKKIAEKLLKSWKEKTNIAYKLAKSLDNDEINLEDIESDDTAYYLIEAINYATNQNN